MRACPTCQDNLEGVWRYSTPSGYRLSTQSATNKAEIYVNPVRTSRTNFQPIRKTYPNLQHPRHDTCSEKGRPYIVTFHKKRAQATLFISHILNVWRKALFAKRSAPIVFTTIHTHLHMSMLFVCRIITRNAQQQTKKISRVFSL